MSKLTAGRARATRAALGAGVAMLAVSGVGIPHTVGTVSASGSGGSTGATFVVDVTTDEGDNQLNDDLCMTPSGGCSLRAAILQANATEGPNRIEFNLPGPGPHTITLNNKLPNISDTTGSLVIDGYTQPGATANTDPLVSNANIEIGVRLDTYVVNRPLFKITSAGNTVRGLAVYDAYFPFLLEGTGATDNHIVGNFIGTDPTATSFRPNPGFTNAAGVQFDLGASHNRLGTPAVEDRNIISGNKSWGVRIEQNETSHNVIQNNIIGLLPDGTNNLSSHGGIDVQFGARDNLIGGRGLREHNVISGLVYSAIDFSHNSFNNQAIGNYIGTDVTGKQGFEWTSNQWGLLVKDDARLNYYEDNVVANQREEGVYNKHNYTGSNTFVNNLIGVGLDGSALGNAENGVQLRGHDDVFERNIIANSGEDGINLDSNNDGGANDDEITENNRLSANSFYDNAEQGIDIAPPNGVNDNDPGDFDGGTQAGLNHPELDEPTVGSLTGTACVGCEVEVYLSDADSVLPQGRQYLGTAIADAVTGAFTYLDARIAEGSTLTALTIDTIQNTSEFAPARATSTLSAWTEFTGDFFETTVDGRPVVTTTDTGEFNGNGADNTSSFVYFDLVAPVAGDYVIDVDVHAPGGNSNSFYVILDGETGDGRLFDTECCDFNGILRDQANQRNVADPSVFTFPAGTHRIGFAFREDGTGIAAAGLRLVDAPGDAPTVTTPGDLTFVRTQAASVAVAATPTGVTYTAIRLPDGLTIDPATGVVSGVPTRAGQFPVTFLVHNHVGITAVDALWTVDVEPLAPVVDPITDQADDIDVAASLQVMATDANDDTLTYSATGLPTGLTIDPASGLISGTPTEGGDFSSVVTVTDGNTTPVDTTFMWTIDPGFVCEVNGSTLTWTDGGAATYHIRHLINGEDNYLGSVNGVLSYEVPSQFGVYKVLMFNPVNQSTTCDAPLGDPLPFSCTVTGDLLTWTNQGANNYFIRQLINGEDNYLGTVAGSGPLEYTVPSQFGAYKVVAYAPGRIETTCDAPLGDPLPFTCTVTGDLLTWTNQGANNYYVRQLINGEDNYLGTVAGSGPLEYTVPSQFGAYKVVAYAPGRIETTCDAPLGDPLPFTCTVTGDTLSWTNQGANNYNVRQQVSGVDQYIGSSTGLSFVLDDSFGTFEVRFNQNGQTVSTTCDGILLPAFTCSVDAAGLVTWTDQQAGTYFVRRVITGVDEYVGSSTGLSYQLTDTAGDFRVLFNRSGTQFTAACPLV